MEENLTSTEVGASTGLRAGHCMSCGRYQFPHRAECPACLVPTVETVLYGPATIIVSTTIMHPPPGAKVDVPYFVGVAAFPEGIRIIGLLAGRLGYGTVVRPRVISPFDDRRTFAFAAVDS